MNWPWGDWRRQKQITWSLRLAEQLAESDPNNLFWQADACFARLRLVEIQAAQGRSDVARANLLSAGSCVEEFNVSGTWSLRYSIQLNSRVLSLSARLIDEKGRAALSEKIESFLAEVVPKLAGAPDRAKLAVEVANAALALGELQMLIGKKSARLNWQRAQSYLQPYVDMQDGAVLTPLASARFHLGDLEGAQAVVHRIQTSSYRHPAFADLVKKLQHVRGGGKSIEPSGERS